MTTLAVLTALTAHPETNSSTVRQAVILLAADVAPAPVADLADMLRCPKPAITKAVDRLEELGLVTRRLNLADRRVVFVELTPRGKIIVRASCQHETPEP